MHPDELESTVERLRECEARFRQVAQCISDVFFLIEVATGRLLYISPACEGLWGRRCAALYAEPDTWLDGVHPDDRGGAAEGRRNGLAGDATPFEYRIVRADGSLRWVEETDTPIGDEANRIVRVIGVVSDVTERKCIEQELRESRLRMDSIVTSAMDAIISLDDSQRIVLANAAADRMFGYAPDELLGLPLNALLPVRFQQAHPEQVATFGRSGVTSRRMGGLRSLSGVRKNGEEFAIEVSISRIEAVGRRIFTAIMRDVTERDRILDELRESERRFSDMLATVGLASVMLDREGRILFCNDYLLDLTDRRREDVIGCNWFDLFVSQSGEHDAVAKAARLAESSSAWLRENEILTRAGAVRQMRWHTVVLRSTDGEPAGWASIGEDITEQRRAEQRIHRLNRVYAVLSEINALIVRAHDRDELFREACRIAVELGQFDLAFIGIRDRVTQRIVPTASAGSDDGLMDSIGEALATDSRAAATLIARAVSGGVPVVSNGVADDPAVVLADRYALAGIRSMAALPLIVGDDAIGVFVLYASDAGFFDDDEMHLLSELSGDIAFAIDHIEKSERLNYLAYYDALTGLANQSLFLERLQQRLHGAPPEEPRKHAVFLLDVERFKTINDTFGRNEGDDLLKQVAERCVRIGGDASRFARVGPDRFAVVASSFDHVDQIGAYLEQRLDAIFHGPFRVAGSDLRVAVKVGVAIAPDDGTDAETLLRHAEAALKKAKATSERYLFFTPEMTARIAERLSLENRLRQAIDDGEFVLHYQPKVDLVSGRLSGAEALLRWNDPQSGLVPPARFIPILEETGLIQQVGAWVMRTAVADYLRWCDAGLPAIRVAVNVSPLQLRNRSFAAQIEQTLAIDVRAAHGLELEITESLIMEDVKHKIAMLNAIRATGVTIAIDDFGTGFSSLSYLSKLPIDTLKIDRAFVIDMTTGPDGLALVSTIINLAHSLQMKVVAEGVESVEQQHLLRRLHCDEMQGYLFSKPVPVDQFEANFLALQQAPIDDAGPPRSDQKA